jgi:hypothetical protein
MVGIYMYCTVLQGGLDSGVEGRMVGVYMYCTLRRLRQRSQRWAGRGMHVFYLEEA